MSMSQSCHSLFDLVLVGLDIHSEYQCVVTILSMVRGTEDDIAVKFVSSRGASS